MTNYYINKKFTCFFLFVSLALLFSLGCGSMSWQKQTMISYQAAGEILNSSKATLQAMCGAGAMSAEDCKAARKAYNDAVDIYKIMGNAAIIAMDTGDSSVYKDMQVQLMELLNKLADFIGRKQ